MHDLAELLPHGVAARQELTLASSATSVARWTAAGALLHVHPGVVMLPDRLEDPLARARAAAVWAKAPLSHLSALWLWELIPRPVHPVHVTVSADRFPRGTPGVVVHRSTRSVPVTTVHGLPAVHLPRSLVDAWSLANGRRGDAAFRAASRRAVIEAVRDRGVSIGAIRTESAESGPHAGKAELRGVLDLVADGCESELEIWGVQHVLPGPPAVPRWVQQHPVRLGDRWVRLDAAYPEALVAVELDGAAFHGSRAARERDLRRDTALAALGWVVLRFSYARLVSDPEGCRREIEAVVRRRLGLR